jgi:hypothetical protein
VVSSQVVNSTYDFATDTVNHGAPATLWRAKKGFVTETYAWDANGRLLQQVTRSADGGTCSWTAPMRTGARRLPLGD